MKKILFRGKDLVTNKWIAGNLYCGMSENGKQYAAIMTESMTEEDPESNDKDAVVFTTDEFRLVDVKTVGQYMMDDRDDMPIYEGDIVMQSYKVTTNNVYGKMADEETDLSGKHLGVAKLTPEGAVITNVIHLDDKGNISAIQPHKNKKIQIRSYRAKVIGNIFENENLLKRKTIENTKRK